VKIFYIVIALCINIGILSASKSIDVDLSKQRIYAKENGRIVFSGAISSGKSGHNTPTGSFRILEKEKFHISNKYPEPHGGAKMPYMHRLTRGGIAIHAGYLPGYPASHGCIRVSRATAKRLWRWSHTGIKVRVYGNASNFRYVKRAKRKRYAKNHNKSKIYRKKGKYYTRKSVMKKSIYHAKRRRVASKRIVRKKSQHRYKKYTQNYKMGYEVIEIYDNW